MQRLDELTKGVTARPWTWHEKYPGATEWCLDNKRDAEFAFHAVNSFEALVQNLDLLISECEYSVKTGLPFNPIHGKLDNARTALEVALAEREGGG